MLITVVATAVACLLVGVVLGGVLARARTRRAHAAELSQLVAVVGPVLERQASKVGVCATPSVALGPEGELVLRGSTDQLARLVELARALEAHEHNDVAFVDTQRVRDSEVAILRSNR